MVTSVEIVRVEPCFTAQEQQALAGFLSGYRGLTREAYALDLRQFVRWCAEHDLPRPLVRSGALPMVSLRRYSRDFPPSQHHPSVPGDA